MPYFIGYRIGDATMEVFWSATIPTSESHRQYLAVVGPLTLNAALHRAMAYNMGMNDDKDAREHHDRAGDGGV